MLNVNVSARDVPFKLIEQLSSSLPFFRTTMSIFGSRSQHRNTNIHNSLPASSVARASSSSHPNTISSGSSFLPTLFPRHRSPRPQPPLNFSRYSSTSVPDGGWACEDFMVGVGMVVIQPTTNKMVLLYDHSGLKGRSYFLPKGRKDLGETLQQAALREAYEEVCIRYCFHHCNLSTYALRAQPSLDLKSTSSLCTNTIANPSHRPIVQMAGSQIRNQSM